MYKYFITHTLHFVEKLLVVLRDGRTLIGYLRSIDQFGKLFKDICICNLKSYNDIPLALNQTHLAAEL